MANNTIATPNHTTTTTFTTRPTVFSHHHHQQQQEDTATAMQIDGEEEEEEQRLVEAASSSSSVKAKERGESKPNLDGLSCPICMEPWGSQGDHQVSCLPCGHVYGLSCITRWIQQRGGNFAKCPQCNVKCMLKDVTKLYASPVVLQDDDLQKKIESLKAEIVFLKTERACLLDIEDNLLKLQDNLLKELRQLKEKQTHLQNVSLGEMGGKPLGVNTAEETEGENSDMTAFPKSILAKRASGVEIPQRHGYEFGSKFGKWEIPHCNFVLEHELAVEGARLFDMDVSYQFLILARRISGMGGTHMLNKINLINPNDSEDIQLPLSTKAVMDLHVSPCGRLALLASLGKRLSIHSMGSNNMVISYDLPDPAWSCSWDVNSPHFIYAGLQNGMLLVFDWRQTMNPLQSMVGLTSRPIHSIHSLIRNPAFCNQSAQKLLTASSAGPCVWNTADSRERPFLVPGLENQGSCISLAYGPSSDDIVASFRPVVQPSNVTVNSQSSHSNSPNVLRQGILGSQVLVKRIASSFYHNMGSASVHLNDVQLTKSAIINVDNCYPLLAYGDQVTHGLRLRELPSLTASQNLKPHQHPILDVKYAHSQGPGLLGCVSEDKLQLFSAKVF